MNKWNENVQNNRNFDRVLIRFGNEVNEILFPARGLLEGNNRRPCFRKDGNRLSRENLRYLHSYIRILAPLLRPPPVHRRGPQRVKEFRLLGGITPEN